MRIVKGKEELDDDLRERGVVSGTTFVNAERPRQQAMISLLGIICKCGRMNNIPWWYLSFSRFTYFLTGYLKIVTSVQVRR